MKGATKKSLTLDKLEVAAALLPVVFVFYTVFFAYDSIQFFAVGGLLIALAMIYLRFEIMSKIKPFSQKIKHFLPFFLLFVGAIGVGASYSLAQEQIAMERDPYHVASCSINPIIACGSVISSDQGHALGVSNPKLGLIAFGTLMLLGFELLLGVVFSKNVWRLLWLGSAFAFVYSLWLISQSLYVIGSLCLYCATIWAVTIPFFYYTTNYLIYESILPSNEKLKKWLDTNHMVPMLVTYGVLLILIYFRWSDYWNSVIS